ncbi:peptidase M14, carboxypeptidase A, partial [Conidiobolus coronatus NRRL 28638]
YHSTKDIYQFMDRLISKHSSIAKSFDVGKTYKGQTIRGVKISKGNGSNKKAWILHGGIHSREWITVSTVSYLMDQLITQSESNSKIKNLLNNFDVYLIPVVNVDGYEHTRTQDRYWRKNLQPIPGTQCTGVDLNRNWDYQWSNSGKDPCKEDYPGTGAFTAPETSNLAKFISNVPNKSVYIDVHAYGNMWMYPYGYKCDQAETSSELHTLSQIATKAMVQEGGPQFKYGSICKTIYPALGSSVDWGYGVAKVKYPFAVELKGSPETGGFVQPASAIIPQGKEFTAAI